MPLNNPHDHGVPLTVGTGEDQFQYNVATAQLEAVKHGTAAAPVTIAGPTLKVSRLDQVTRATVTAASSAGSDGAEQVAAISGISVGTASAEVQSVGIYGAAKNSSTTIEAGGDDACAVYGLGRVTGSGTGVAIGGFMAGRRENDTGSVTALEVHCANYGTLAPAYVSNGFSKATGIWVNCSGNANSSSAITVSNAFGRQFENGLSFTAQVTSALTGGVVTSTIRDDSSSVTSLDIRGTHTNALTIGSTAGKVEIGATQAVTDVKVYIKPTVDTMRGLLIQGFSATQSGALQSWWTSAGSSVLFVGQATSTTGSIIVGDGTNLSFGTTTGSKIATDGTTKLGFWGATPIIRPTGWGSPTGTATRTTFDTTTVTLPLLAERVKALIDDLKTEGLLGA